MYYVPDNVLSMRGSYFILIPTLSISIVQINELRGREVKYLDQITQLVNAEAKSRI